MNFFQERYYCCGRTVQRQPLKCTQEYTVTSFRALEKQNPENHPKETVPKPLFSEVAAHTCIKNDHDSYFSMALAIFFRIAVI